MIDVDYIPTVSVLMPVFNGDQYLANAIDSVLAQTFRDFEFIIFDDGSTDGTTKILQNFEKSDNRIRVYHQSKNLGIVATLNKSLTLAKGKYIARMDADDICLPDRLENQIAFLEKHPEVGVLSGNIQLIDCNGKTSTFLKFPESNTKILWSFCYFCPIVHPAVMMRRQIVLDAGGYRNVRPHAEDYDLWIRLSQNTQFANLPRVLLKLRKHESNITVLHQSKNVASSIKISQEFISQLLKKEVPIDVIEIIWNQKPGRPDEVEKAAKIIINIYRYFLTTVHLESKERHYFQKETSRYLVRLLSGNIPVKTAKEILLSALLYNPYTAIIYLIKTSLRTIKKFIVCKIG